MAELKLGRPVLSMVSVSTSRIGDISGWSGVVDRVDRHAQIGLASQHALNERRGFVETARTCEVRSLKHHVIHIEAIFCSEKIVSDAGSARRTSPRSNFPSSHSIGESGLDLGTGVQRSQHDDRSDSGAG